MLSYCAVILIIVFRCRKCSMEQSIFFLKVQNIADADNEDV